MKNLAISDFKARCLEVINDMQIDGNPVVVTKRGKPVARVVPISSKGSKLNALQEVAETFRGRGEIVGDIVSSIDEEWDAEK